MKKVLFILSLFLTLTTLYSQKKLKFEFDYARYMYDSATVFLEIYYTIDQADLIKVDKDGKKIVEATLKLNLTDKNSKEEIFNKNWNIPSLANKNTSLQGVLGLFVPIGTYEFKLKAADKNNSELNTELVENIDITAFDESKVALSDIELARNIKREGVDKNSIFYKNTLEVIPNPELVYTNTSPNLFYYTEIYDVATECATNLFYHQILLNGANKEVMKKSKKLARKPGARIDIGRFDLRKLPTDSYKLVLVLSDSCNQYSYSAQKQFYFYNPGVFDTTQYADNKFDESFLSGKFATMSEEECDDLFDKAIYIAKQEEINEYKKLNTIVGKREFMHKFWSVRQKGKYNNFDIPFEEYYRRADYADKYFRAMGTRGYKSDRGRVYMMYGPPDDIVREPSSIDMKPYVIWYYYAIESGVEFYFGDLNSYGNMQLLHSTKRGEVANPDFLGQLRIMN